MDDTTATYTTDTTATVPTDILDDLATAVMATTAAGPTMILDPSANLVEMVMEVEDRPPFMEPIPVSPPLSRSASQHSLALSPPASPAVRVQPPATPPPATPPPHPMAEEPPALRQRRGFRVRTFCAERAGSDTESTESEDDEEEEGPSLRTYSLPTALAMEAAAALPVPTTPLTRQIACPMSPIPAPATEDEATEDEDETEAEEADDEAEAEEEEEAEQEQQQGTPELIVPIPLWLFATTLVALVAYLFFIVYLLSSRCDVPLRH